MAPIPKAEASEKKREQWRKASKKQREKQKAQKSGPPQKSSTNNKACTKEASRVPDPKLKCPECGRQCYSASGLTQHQNKAGCRKVVPPSNANAATVGNADGTNDIGGISGLVQSEPQVAAAGGGNGKSISGGANYFPPRSPRALAKSRHSLQPNQPRPIGVGGKISRTAAPVRPHAYDGGGGVGFEGGPLAGAPAHSLSKTPGVGKSGRRKQPPSPASSTAVVPSITGGGNVDIGGVGSVGSRGNTPNAAPALAKTNTVGVGLTRVKDDGTVGGAAANDRNGINGDGGIGFGVGAAASLKSPPRSHGLPSFQMETQDGNILTVFAHGGTYFTCFPGSSTIDFLDLMPCRQSGTYYLFYNDTAIGIVPPVIVAQATIGTGQYDSNDPSDYSGGNRRGGTSTGRRKDDRQYADGDASVESPVRSRQLFHDTGVASGGGGIGAGIEHSDDTDVLDGDDNASGCLKSPGRNKLAPNRPVQHPSFRTQNRHRLTSRPHATPNIITDPSTPLPRAPLVVHPNTEPSVAKAIFKFVEKQSEWNDEQKRCNDNNDRRWKEQDNYNAKTNGRLDTLEGDVGLLAHEMLIGHSESHQRHDQVEMRQKQLEMGQEQLVMGHDRLKMGQDELRTEMKVWKEEIEENQRRKNSLFKW